MEMISLQTALLRNGEHSVLWNVFDEAMRRNVEPLLWVPPFPHNVLRAHVMQGVSWDLRGDPTWWG